MAELPSTPVYALVRCHSSVTLGRMKAISAPSIASKV
jgi:hypothetical protein